MKGNNCEQERRSGKPRFAVPSAAAGRARENHTVNDWKRLRFETDYPDFVVDVVLADGRVATGKTRLARVRRSFE
jgi:hypothetical protein